jgi:hypothetical protein
MTFQPGAMVYTQGFGSRPEDVEVPHLDTRAPSPQDILYPIGKKWVYINNSVWELIGLNTFNGITTANWIEAISSTGNVLSVTGTANQILASPTTGNVVLSLIGPYSASSYTAHTVLLGEGSTAIGTTSVGTDGQVLTGNTAADPTFDAIGTKSGLTLDGVILGGGAGPFTATTAGVAGQILTSNGAGVAPTFQTAGGGTTADYADFYALMPGDNAATIAVGAPILLPNNGPTSGTSITRLTSSTFNLADIATYSVSFQVSFDEAGQWMLKLNGSELAATVSGRATGTNQCYINCLITTSTINSVLSVVNPSGNAAALTITPIAGGTHAVSAHLVIQRIAGGPGGGLLNTISSVVPVAGNINIAGTTNEITVTPTAGTLTLTTPSTFVAPGTITATLGNITATNGNLSLATAGNKVVIATGANASAGTSAAMSAGAVTVSTTASSATALIFYSRKTLGGTMGNVSITAQDGTGFTLTSSSGSETSTFYWWIINL